MPTPKLRKCEQLGKHTGEDASGKTKQFRVLKNYSKDMGVELTFMNIFMILFSYFHDTLYNFLIIQKSYI